MYAALPAGSPASGLGNASHSFVLEPGYRHGSGRGDGMETEGRCVRLAKRRAAAIVAAWPACPRTRHSGWGRGVPHPPRWRETGEGRRASAPSSDEHEPEAAAAGYPKHFPPPTWRYVRDALPPISMAVADSAPAGTRRHNSAAHRKEEIRWLRLRRSA